MQQQEVSAAKVSKEGICRLLSFLPFFEECDGTDYGVGPKVAAVEKGVASIRPAALSPKASDFVTACYEEHFVQPFDWGDWNRRHGGDLTSDAFIAEADLSAIIKMLTAHIRADRFCDGHLLSVMKDGTALKILKRLRDIHSEQGPGA